MHRFINAHWFYISKMWGSDSMKTKGASLKTRPAAPEKSWSPGHPVPPNPSLAPSTLRGLLPGGVQLTSSELTQLGCAPVQGGGTKCPLPAAGSYRISSRAAAVLGAEREAPL